MPTSDESHFHSAVRSNDIPTIHEFINKGVDINCIYYGTTALHLAIANDHTDLAVWLIEKGADTTTSPVIGTPTPFEEAIKHNQVKVVETLAKQGAKVDDILSCGIHTPLTMTASKGLTNLAQTLIDGGADVNAENTRGETALWTSIHGGHIGLMDLLIKYKAVCDRACGPQNLTPLLFSIVQEQFKASKILIQAGCDLDACDSGGWTALWHAVTSGNESLVRLLVKHGADTTIADVDGHTVLEEARDNEEDNIVDILKTAAR